MADKKKIYDEYGLPTLEAELAALQANRPGAYSSKYNDQIASAYNDYANYGPFQYDANSDALYQSLKDSYRREGKRAAADTMGMAAALTGGYGNSYAAAAANQAYQNKLTQLADRIPELAQMARSNYESDRNAILQKYNLLSDMENRNYSQYRDTVSDYNTQLNYLTNRYDTKQASAWNDYTYQNNYEYQQQQDQIANALAREKFEEEKRQAELDSSYKWASLAQANKASEYQAMIDELKAQIGDYQSRLADYEDRYSGKDLTDTAKKELYKELAKYSSKYSEEQAAAEIGSKWIEKGYSKDSVYKYIADTYDRKTYR